MSDYYGTLAVTCPKCGAEVGKRCRSLTTNRSTDTHVARFEVRYSAVGADDTPGGGK